MGYRKETHPLTLLSKVKKPNTIRVNYTPETHAVKVRSTLFFHSKRETTTTAARVGVCLCVGFHFSAILIDTLSRIPISVDGKITWANILWFIHWIYLCIISIMYDLKHKNIRRKKRISQKRGIPPLPHSSSDTAYGQTSFCLNWQNTNRENNQLTRPPC